MDTLRTLEILITSRTPLIAIETLEEERAEQALERVAGRLRIPLFTWTMTRGLRRSGAVDSIYETKEPLKALRSVAEMNEGIYLMKDLYRSLNDAAVVRTIQDRALATAERMAPCVLMIDEIEKGFASVVSSESDGGLSRRILGRLLGWLQDRSAPVFLVATCNQIDALPPELIRKGRFDEIFFIDLPTADERRQIFSIHLARRHRDPAGFDLAALAAASEGFSGAEIEQAVVSALYTAFARGVEISTDLIVDELKATKPLSVTRAEDIEELREWARGRAVPAA